MGSMTIEVKGMTCEHCQAAVEGALAGIAGVNSAKVDLAGGTADVAFDETAAGEEDFKKAIEEAGFEVG